MSSRARSLWGFTYVDLFFFDTEFHVAAGRVELDRGYVEAALGLFVDSSDDRFARWRAIADPM